MPFGRYKGCLLTVLPDDYLLWLMTIDVRPPLRGAIKAEYLRRFDEPAHRQGRRQDARRTLPSRDVAEALIAAGTRVLALKHHPDRGGSHEMMVAVNGAAEWLRGRLGELTS
jgi:hypothetical protein